MQKTQKDTVLCSAIILAAGKSSRMGNQKFALKFDDTHTFLEQIIKEYKNFGCQKIIVVLNAEGVVFVKRNLPEIYNNVVIVTNNHLEWERFYSIKLGIQNLANTHPVFIHNVDNPFVNFSVLDSLFINADSDYTVPTYEGHGGHPILLSKNVIKGLLIENKNDLIFSEFLKNYTKNSVSVNDKQVLVNINTKEKYLKFFDF